MLICALLMHDEDAAARGNSLNVAGLATHCALGRRFGVVDHARLVGPGLIPLQSSALVVGVLFRLPAISVLCVFRLPPEMGQGRGDALLIFRV
jgi:hypothetical protein